MNFMSEEEIISNLANFPVGIDVYVEYYYDINKKSLYILRKEASYDSNGIQNGTVYNAKMVVADFFLPE